jgi:hypothetical protein
MAQGLQIPFFMTYLTWFHLKRFAFRTLCLTLGLLLNLGIASNANGDKLRFFTSAVTTLEMDVQVLSNSIFRDWYPFKQWATYDTVYPLVERGREKEDVPHILASSDRFEVQLGSLKTTIDFNDTWPFAGIGWWNALGKKKEWDVVLGVGVIFQDSTGYQQENGSWQPVRTFSLSDRSHINTPGPCLSGRVQYYPMISVGFTYQF